jgi:hypothetical protein
MSIARTVALSDASVSWTRRWAESPAAMATDEVSASPFASSHARRGQNEWWAMSEIGSDVGVSAGAGVVISRPPSR